MATKSKDGSPVPRFFFTSSGSIQLSQCLLAAIHPFIAENFFQGHIIRQE
jgi:hypothetical protein